MDYNYYQEYVEKINGMAGIYSFDIMPDGSFSEIRLIALNKMNGGVLNMNPDAPKFYPGIPWRTYFTDINFESYIYNCASNSEFLYSYTNAHGFWLKGFYLPLKETEEKDGIKTVYCLYVGTFSPQLESDAMAQHSLEVSSAVMNISVRLHESQDFQQSMAATIHEIKKICLAEKCGLFTINKNTMECDFISENGLRNDVMEQIASEMGRTPYEVAQAWENDLADSDCLLLDNLSVVKERDPVWYASLCINKIENLVLYGVRFDQSLIGFICAANFDTTKMMLIKETLELSSFLLGTVIANHQIMSHLKVMSTIDALTQVSSRNAMDERVKKLVSGESKLPDTMGVAFIDLNGLKNVNDTKGHNAGDMFLNRAASVLKLAFGDYEIYRAGGDEFVVLCPDITQNIMEERITQLRALSDNTHDVSFSVGYVWLSGSYDINSAMRTADERMFKDKEEYYKLHAKNDRRIRVNAT
ncbi:MAG: GGDEF domain-containing protein [Ruminococcus sp.]|nr:GGDEF domain-containing protein [Ruminococcus sp.]